MILDLHAAVLVPIEHDRIVAKVRSALGEETFAAVWTKGREMTLEQAIAYALEYQ